MQNKRIIKCVAMMVMALCLIFAPQTKTKVNAAGLNYTITFRAGNVGNFNTASKNLEVSSKVGSNSVSKVEVKQKYVRITAKKGTSVATAIYDGFGYAVTDSNSLYTFFAGAMKENSEYALLSDTTRWGISDAQLKGTDGGLKKNLSFVLDYGKLVNPVSYTIQYVDAQSNAAIAAPVIVYGSDGQKVTANPIAISQYATNNKAVDFTLKKGENNTVTFYYTFTGTVFVPGNVTNRTEYVDVVLPTTVTIPAATVTTGTGTTATGTTATGTTPAATGTPGAAAGTPGAAAGTPGAAAIDDQAVPNAANENVNENEGNDDGNEATIDDNKTPKSDGQSSGENKSSRIGLSSTTAVIIIGAVALVVAFGVGVFTAKKRKH